MTKYNTGNPVGSSSPLDLYDNAENLDAGINGSEVGWVDRRGQTRKSWTGVETDFQKFLADGSTIEFPTWAAAAAAAGAGQIPVNRQVAVIGDVGVHIDSVSGTEVPNQGRYVMTAGGLQWRARDVVALKADNTTETNSSGAVAVLATEAGDVLVALDASGRRRVPSMSMSDGLEMSVRDDLTVRGVESVTVKGGRVVGYQHQLGTVVDFTRPPDASPRSLGSCIGGASHERSRIYGAAYNQWIFPTFCTMKGRRWLGTMGQGGTSPDYFGGLSINEKIGQATWMQYEFDRQQFVQEGYQTDDHNGPAVLLDPRPNARHPLMVFQADHSGPGSYFRCWRSRTADAAGLGEPRIVSMAGNMSYAQAFRNPVNPDEIITFSRQGGSSSAIWMIYRSTDEMDSVHSARLIAGDDLYMMARPAINGLGLHILIQQHPQNGVDQRVLYLYYRFSDRSLWNWAGDLVVADVMASGSFDPFSVSGPTTVYTPAAGRKKRLFDVMETSLGVVEVVLVDFVDSGVKPGTWKHVRMAPAGITASQIGADDTAGNPIEASANSYFGGIALTGAYGAIAAVWDRVSNTGGLYRLTSPDGGTTWQQVLIEASGGLSDKVIRPTILTEFYWANGQIGWVAKPAAVFLRGTYQLYLNFNLDAQEVTL